MLAVLSAMIFAPVFALTARAAAGDIDPSQPIFSKLQIPLPFVNVGGTTRVLQSDGTYKEGVACKDDEENDAVCDVTDYIKGVYRLLIGLGALFAVVMMIIAGYQWIFSGGSADKTGDAKKRIMNAAIGLILALLSYVILNTITPRLVDLRLPRIVPVKPIFYNLEDTKCDSPRLLDNVLSSLNNKSPQEQEHVYEQKEIDQFFTDANTKLDFIVAKGDKPVSVAEATCNKNYSVIKQGTTANPDVVGDCLGNSCIDSQESCMQNGCQPIFMQGSIDWELFTNAYVDYIWIIPICGNLPMDPVAKIDVKEKGKSYRIPREFDANGLAKYANAKTKCENDRPPAGFDADFYGFVMKIEVNDDSSFWGSTDDDNFGIGKNCQPLGYGGSSFEHLGFRSLRDSLFQVDDFKRGVTCDLYISRSTFPPE